VILAAALMGAPFAGHARDFPQPITMGDPFSVASQPGLLPGGRADVGFHHYTFLKGRHDLFSLRQRTSIGLFASDTVAASVYYHNFLLIGPIHPGETPFSIAEWNMNALQFEYGVAVGLRTPQNHRFALEYGRTSQHPFRGGYSEVSLDIVEASFYHRPVLLGGSGPCGQIDAGVRLAYVDLYDYWGSPLSAPRARFRLEIPIESSWDLNGGTNLVARAWPRLLFMRGERAWWYANIDPPVQIEIDAEIGVRLERVSGIELLVEYFFTRDTEQVSGEPAPLRTLGLIARIGTR
jgi:hypothetical protein